MRLFVFSVCLSVCTLAIGQDPRPQPLPPGHPSYQELITPTPEDPTDPIDEDDAEVALNGSETGLTNAVLDYIMVRLDHFRLIDNNDLPVDPQSPVDTVPELVFYYEGEIKPVYGEIEEVEKQLDYIFESGPSPLPSVEMPSFVAMYEERVDDGDLQYQIAEGVYAVAEAEYNAGRWDQCVFSCNKCNIFSGAASSKYNSASFPNTLIQGAIDNAMMAIGEEMFGGYGNP